MTSYLDWPLYLTTSYTLLALLHDGPLGLVRAAIMLLGGWAWFSGRPWWKKKMTARRALAAYRKAESTKPPGPTPEPEPDDDFAGFFRALFLACFIGLTLFGVLGGALYFIFHDYIRGVQ